MGEEAKEKSLSLLSLKDFEERGINIDRNWTGLQALQVVAKLASEKLKEERFPIETCFADEKGKEKAPCCLVFDNFYSKKNELGFLNNKAKKVMGVSMKASIQKGSKKSGNKKPKREIVPMIPVDLPERFREKIEQLRGSQISLVIDKRLFQTDVCNHQCRLSIPAKQVKSPEFLMDNEKGLLNNGGEIQLKYFIEPSLEECEGEMIFKRQMDVKKTAGKSSFSYVLNKGWVKVKNRNSLECNDRIQLWKFRSIDEQLCFALVLVDEP